MDLSFALRRILGSVSFTRRLPERFGRRPIVVTPDARIKFLLPYSDVFEHEYGELLSVAVEHVGAGDTVWDIGSNVGIFTFAAAARAGRGGMTLSVEPDIELVRLLRRSAQQPGNADLNVEILPAAVSDRSGVASFLIAGQGRTTNTLESTRRLTESQKTRDRQLVPTVTLDQLLEVSDFPDVLKVDVEGAEDRVLEGGSCVLTKARPLIYCEVGEEKRGRVTNILKENNYNIFDPKGEGIWGRQIDECVFNTLAIPREDL